MASSIFIKVFLLGRANIFLNNLYALGLCFINDSAIILSSRVKRLPRGFFFWHLIWDIKKLTVVLLTCASKNCCELANLVASRILSLATAFVVNNRRATEMMAFRAIRYNINFLGVNCLTLVAPAN